MILCTRANKNNRKNLKGLQKIKLRLKKEGGQFHKQVSEQKPTK